MTTLDLAPVCGVCSLDSTRRDVRVLSPRDAVTLMVAQLASSAPPGTAIVGRVPVVPAEACYKCTSCSAWLKKASDVVEPFVGAACAPDTATERRGAQKGPGVLLCDGGGVTMACVALRDSVRALAKSCAAGGVHVPGAVVAMRELVHARAESAAAAAARDKADALALEEARALPQADAAEFPNFAAVSVAAVPLVVAGRRDDGGSATVLSSRVVAGAGVVYDVQYAVGGRVGRDVGESRLVLDVENARRPRRGAAAPGGTERSLGAAPSEPSATDRAIAAETALRTTTRELAAARRAAHGAAARLRDLELDLTRARAGMLGREADLSALARRHDALRRRHDEGERRAATLRRHNEELRVEGETVRQKLLLALSLLEEYQAQLARLGAL